MYGGGGVGGLGTGGCPDYICMNIIQQGGFSHEALKVLMPGYDLGNCMSAWGDCSTLDWFLAGVGSIPGGKLASLGGTGILAIVLAKSRKVPNSAHSSANAARLRGQLAGDEIAGGHAFEKHVIQRGEFTGLGIRTREQFARHIENVVNNPSASRQLSGGRTAFWDDATGTVVIRNPRAADGGTAFRPTLGREYFEDILQ